MRVKKKSPSMLIWFTGSPTMEMIRASQYLVGEMMYGAL
jgi:hypothetical protein